MKTQQKGKPHIIIGPDLPFGQVKIFNERSDNTIAYARVQLCTTRGLAGVADSGMLGISPAPAGSNPVTWQPFTSVLNVMSVLVDTWDSDGQTQRYTFGLYGVGNSDGITQVSNVQVTISGTDAAGTTVAVAICTVAGKVWTTVRTATQAPITTPVNDAEGTCTGNGEMTAQLADSTLADTSGVQQSATILVTDGNLWKLVQAAATYPTQYQIVTKLKTSADVQPALGRWLVGTAPSQQQLAGLTNPPTPFRSSSTNSNLMLLIEYSDGGYQVVDSTTGLALTSPSTASNTQLQFIQPDPNPVGTYAQFWNNSNA